MTRQEMMEVADANGVEYKKNISNDALSELIGEYISAKEDEVIDTDAELAKAAEEAAKIKAELEASKIEEPAKKEVNKPAEKTKADYRREATKLVRCIVTSMDKDSAEANGEIISCGNSFTGMVKKYIPFGKEWHIPQIIVDTLQEKKMLAVKDRQTPKGIVKENYEISKYNVQILPDLTQEELDRLTKENK